MARVRQLANGPCRRQRIGPLHSGVCVRYVLLVTRDASEGKWCGAVPRFCRLIRISFSARLETPAMGNTEPNCVGPSQPCKATERPITTPKSAFCCASTGNMAQEPSYPTWPDCCL